MGVKEWPQESSSGTIRGVLLSSIGTDLLVPLLSHRHLSVNISAASHSLH